MAHERNTYTEARALVELLVPFVQKLHHKCEQNPKVAADIGDELNEVTNAMMNLGTMLDRVNTFGREAPMFGRDLEALRATAADVANKVKSELDAVTDSRFRGLTFAIALAFETRLKIGASSVPDVLDNLSGLVQLITSDYSKRTAPAPFVYPLHVTDSKQGFVIVDAAGTEHDSGTRLLPGSVADKIASMRKSYGDGACYRVERTGEGIRQAFNVTPTRVEIPQGRVEIPPGGSEALRRADAEKIKVRVTPYVETEHHEDELRITTGLRMKPLTEEDEAKLGQYDEFDNRYPTPEIADAVRRRATAFRRRLHSCIADNTPGNPVEDRRLDRLVDELAVLIAEVAHR